MEGVPRDNTFPHEPPTVRPFPRTPQVPVAPTNGSEALSAAMIVSKIIRIMEELVPETEEEQFMTVEEIASLQLYRHRLTNYADNQLMGRHVGARALMGGRNIRKLICTFD
jgi:hypothetical protein